MLRRPCIGHFTQPDTIIPDPSNSQDLHRYTYVRNNPTNYNDPTGHDPCLGGGGGCGRVREGDTNGDGFVLLDNPGCDIWCSPEEFFHTPAMKQTAIRDFYGWHGLIDSRPITWADVQGALDKVAPIVGLVASGACLISGGTNVVACGIAIAADVYQVTSARIHAEQCETSECRWEQRRNAGIAASSLSLGLGPNDVYRFGGLMFDGMGAAGHLQDSNTPSDWSRFMERVQLSHSLETAVDLRSGNEGAAGGRK